MNIGDTDKPWLDGFWRDEHNTLQKVPKRLRAGVRERAKARLERMAHYRQFVLDSNYWDQWLFQAEELE